MFGVQGQSDLPFESHRKHRSFEEAFPNYALNSSVCLLYALGTVASHTVALVATLEGPLGPVLHRRLFPEDRTVSAPFTAHALSPSPAPTP